jgi:hypothetical protein
MAGVTLTGLGTGGALAQLGLLHLTLKFPKDLKLKLKAITYGVPQVRTKYILFFPPMNISLTRPQVGNQAFADL